jgi:hypothetical protein
VREFGRIEAVASGTIHVVPDDSFEDWLVRTEIGSELGHYATREAAELAAEAMAHNQGIEIVVHLPDGKTISRNLRKRWLARLFSR